MKINFLGDSITAGAGASTLEQSYVRLVEARLNCEVRNYGISGTRIAKQKMPSADPSYDLDFQTRSETMEGKANFVFVFGGTNDWGHGDAEIGVYGDTDGYTFYGALHNLIDILMSKYEKDKIIFILPLKRFGESNPLGEGHKKKLSLPLCGYVKILREVLEKNGFEYLNFYENGLPEPMTDKQSEWFLDGVHPNDRGHKWIAERIIEFIQNKQEDL